MPSRHIRIALVCAIALPVGIPDCFAIISGTEAAAGELPWIAGIVKKGNFATTAIIGCGTLIDGQRVVTAAHAIANEDVGSIEIWIGMNNLGAASTIIRRDVLAIYRHPDFSTSEGVSEADLAILVLDEPVYGIATLPILGDPENLQSGDSLEVAGFGTTDSEVLEPSPILLKANAEIIVPSMGPPPYNLTPLDSRLAAVDPLGKSTPCRGDSGGPLLKEIGGIDTLVGIVSYGSIDCDPNIPSVYTNVAYFSNWIRMTLSLPIPTPTIIIAGKGHMIVPGDGSPAKIDGTEFGRSRSRVSRIFVVGNSGNAPLSVYGLQETHRDFSILSSPAEFLLSGGRTSFKIAYTPRKRQRRSRAWLRISTSDPVTPICAFRIAGRSKR